jgi:hypothetical protein
MAAGTGSGALCTLSDPECWPVRQSKAPRAERHLRRMMVDDLAFLQGKCLDAASRISH